MRHIVVRKPLVVASSLALVLLVAVVALLPGREHAAALPSETIPPFRADLRITSDGEVLTGELVYLGQTAWLMSYDNGYQQLWQDGVLYVSDADMGYTTAFTEIERAIPGPWFVTPSTARGRGAVDTDDNQLIATQDGVATVYEFYEFDDTGMIPVGYQIVDGKRLAYELRLSNVSKPDRSVGAFTVPDVDVWPDKAPQETISPATRR